jgi:hypothetical protein
MQARAKDNEDFIGDQMAKLDEVKNKLWEIAERENWHVRLLNGVNKKMVKGDFDNVKISLLNVAQNKYCNTTANNGIIRENELCWKTPRREPANLADYKNSYNDLVDDDTYWDVDGLFGDEYDEVSYAADSEYFHIQNMKILQNYVLDFMKHPVKTEKEEIKKDLANDVREFETEYETILQADKKLSRLFNNSDINTDKCVQESKSILDEQKLQISCPRWSNWESGECSTECGLGIVTFNRTCLDGNNQKLEVEKCQNEYKNDADYTREQSCNQGPCVWSDWKPGQCSKNCGGGTRHYIRECNGIGCLGSTVKEESCNTNDCEWSSWDISGPCSRKCGTGEQLLTRRCNGTGCSGPHTKMVSCNTAICDWNNWTVLQMKKMVPDTELTSNNIIQRSYVNMENAKKIYCPKCDSRKDLYQLIYSRDCDGHTCSTTEKTFADSEQLIIRCDELQPCKWGDWKVAKGDCKKTSDATSCNRPSERILTRSCLGDYCEPEGQLKTTSTKKEQCAIIPCEWAKWASWSTCDKTCGTGYRSRHRYCNGIGCVGNASENQKCSTHICRHKTRISWDLDYARADWADGSFGFSLFGSHGLLYQRVPSYTTKSGSVEVVGVVERIEFDAYKDNNGALLRIKVTQDGKPRTFKCSNCRPSYSYFLDRIYVDTDMNAGLDIGGTSNCQNKCNFNYLP